MMGVFQKRGGSACIVTGCTDPMLALVLAMALVKVAPKVRKRRAR